MNWLAFASIFAVVALRDVVMSAQPVTLTGTCASIGYSNSCCPPRTDCQAADGNCQCGADCHVFGDCCDDFHCPSQPRTCADVGLTSCCNDVNGTGKCDVYFRDSQNNRCSCNISCHLRNDCCSDAVAIGCSPQTCTEAGKNPGCCIGSGTACYVSGSRCYCDAVCTSYNDCCRDVSASACPLAGARLSRSRMQSVFEQKIGALQVRQSEGKKHMGHAENDNS